MQFRVYPCLIVLSFVLFSGCATYTQKNNQFFESVNQGDFNRAATLLKSDDYWEKHPRNRLLFYLNKGALLHMMGAYQESNVYLQKADYFVEDFQKNHVRDAASLVTNPNMEVYSGEEFEKVLINYYGAMNYLMLGNLDEALVEGKRMLIKVQRMNDRFKSANKFRRDAWAHNLIGLIYDAKGDYNNAFIAYKNAYEIYSTDYLPMFGIDAPAQLKSDLLRTAYLMGFNEDLKKYEQLFNQQYDPKSNRTNKQVLFFWDNGLGPVKDESSIQFTVLPFNNGYVQFVNMDHGWSFPIYVGNEQQVGGLLKMRFVKMALPKYLKRIPAYKGAYVLTNNTKYPLEVCEDVNAIAVKSLNDRLTKDLAEAVIRVALKQLAVYLAQQEKNEGLAFAASLYGILSESADTRCWELLPSTISYTRIPIENNTQVLRFQPFKMSTDTLGSSAYTIQIQPGQTKFLSARTIACEGFLDQ